MKISVEYISKLARLSVSEKEREAFSAASGYFELYGKAE